MQAAGLVVIPCTFLRRQHDFDRNYAARSVAEKLPEGAKQIAAGAELLHNPANARMTIP